MADDQRTGQADWTCWDPRCQIVEHKHAGTGQADTAPQAHIDAVALVLGPCDLVERWCYAHDGAPTDAGPCEAVQASALAVLDSTDAAVHAALLAALTRHGVLTEERRTIRPCGCPTDRNALMCCDASAPTTTFRRFHATVREPTP